MDERGAPLPIFANSKRRWLAWLRFSLRTLLILVLLIGSGVTLWWNWQPWVFERRLEVRSAAYSPDGKRIILFTTDGFMQGLDPATDTTANFEGVDGTKEMKEPKETRGRFFYLSIEHCRIFGIASDKSAHVWDTSSGKSIATMKGEIGLIESADLSSDARRIATCSKSKVQIWDADNGTEITAIDSPAEDISLISFTSDGRRICRVAQEGMRIWDVDTGQQRAFIEAPTRKPLDSVMSRDRRLVATSWGDRSWEPDSIRIYNTDMGIEQVNVSGRGFGFNTAAFSPDGRYLAAAKGDAGFAKDYKLPADVHICDTSSSAEVGILHGHAERISSVAYSPDGRLLVTSSSDYTIRIWDAATFSELAQLKGAGWNWSAHFSPDGNRLLTTGYGGAAFWNRRRPEYAWGIAWLPEFWLSIVFSIAFIFSAARDRRMVRP